MVSKIKVAIVDDSAFMRKSLSIILESDPEIEIVGTARDGLDGIELIKKTRPDIVTLDIEMPRLDGLSALKRIMKECPTSVIMVSSLTTEGADATLKALELGAVDFISKEMSYVSVKIIDIKNELLRKIKTFAKQQALRNRLLRIQNLLHKDKSKSELDSSTASHRKSLPIFNYKAIAIGISTGGPISLQKIIPKISGQLNLPIFIVQHMPPTFTKSLSDRLNSLSNLTVKEAADNDLVQSGHVYIAPGGKHMYLYRNGTHQIKVKISEQPADSLHKPSVDVMLNSVIEMYGNKTLGIIMTGMGKDGLEGVRKLKSLGGYAVAQDESSSVVYGMPRAIVDEGFADLILSLDKIPSVINGLVKR